MCLTRVRGDKGENRTRKFKRLLKHYLEPTYRSLYFPPAIIFITVLIATITGWQAAQNSLEQDLINAADMHTIDAEQSIREQIVVYEQILRGGAGLFQSSNEVTLDEWESFLNALGVDKGSAGVQGIGFIRVFGKSELSQTQTFMTNQGVSDYTINPAQPEREEYAAILYIHAVESAQNLPYGYDMYTEPTRSATMQKSRDSGEITMTPAIELLPADPRGPRIGFSMFNPYYERGAHASTVAERQQALRGYVYASFRADQFFKDTIINSRNEGFLVTTGSGDKSRVMYQSSAYKKILNQDRSILAKRSIKFYGQTWNINYAAESRELVSDEQLARPNAVLAIGTFSAALISMIVLLLIRARARDLSTQKERAVELAKDELLSLASHQLRTPATGVKQYVGMVLQGFAGKVSPTQKKLLEKAYASNDRQLRIINEILHLAKIDSGRIVLAKQPTNLNELVGDIVNEQRPDIESSEHNIKVKLPKTPLVIYADTHILRMALENLLSNAIKYTPNGGHISVRLHKDWAYAYISVTDNGVGISADDTDKIFKQFSRLSNVMSQQVGGTGIGLYLAKHLVELHKGYIAVKSKPGKGSTFTIAMPLDPDIDEHMRNLTVWQKG